MHEEGAPVVVWRCSGDAEAEVVRGLLVSFGIPCNLASDITHVAYPFTVDGLGEVRVSVPAAAAGEARAIIEAHLNQEASPASEAEEEAGGGPESPEGGEAA